MHLSWHQPIRYTSRDQEVTLTTCGNTWCKFTNFRFIDKPCKHKGTFSFTVRQPLQTVTTLHKSLSAMTYVYVSLLLMFCPYK